jgi:hypothetical protein
MAYSTVSDLDRVSPREIFPAGVCDTVAPTVADEDEVKPLDTVNAAVGSESGFMRRSSTSRGLLYWRQMSWKKSSWASLFASS